MLRDVVGGVQASGETRVSVLGRRAQTGRRDNGARAEGIRSRNTFKIPARHEIPSGGMTAQQSVQVQADQVVVFVLSGTWRHWRWLWWWW